VKGRKNVGILQQSGRCERGGVRNVAGNAGASNVCKKPTATFLILDITDKLSKHTQCVFKVQACNIQIFNAASVLIKLVWFALRLQTRQMLRILHSSSFEGCAL